MFTLVDVAINNFGIVKNNIVNNKGNTIAMVFWFNHGCIMIINPDEEVDEDNVNTISNASNNITCLVGTININSYDKIDNSVLYLWDDDISNLFNPLDKNSISFSQQIKNMDLETLTTYINTVVLKRDKY